MDSNSLKRINTWAKNRVVVDDQEMIAEFLHEVNKFYKHYMFYSAEAMADRKMVISVTHGAYDQPSLLILEVQGSPPKFEMIVETSYGSHVGIRSINGKKLRKSSITNLPWIESVLERFISKVDKKYRPQNIFTTEKMVDVVKREREEEHRKKKKYAMDMKLTYDEHSFKYKWFDRYEKESNDGRLPNWFKAEVDEPLYKYEFRLFAEILYMWKIYKFPYQILLEMSNEVDMPDSVISFLTIISDYPDES